MGRYFKGDQGTQKLSQMVESNDLSRFETVGQMERVLKWITDYEYIEFKDAAIAIERFLKYILDKIREDLNAGLSKKAEKVLIVYEKEQYIIASSKIEKDKEKFISSVLKKAIKNNETVFTTNIKVEQDFAQRESVKNLQINSVICVPIRFSLLPDEVIGAIYTDVSTVDGFTEDDKKYIEKLAVILAPYIYNLIPNLQTRISKKEDSEICEIIGNCPQIMELKDRFTRLNQDESPVLIQGETGTGKDLLALWIHQNSARKNGQFKMVDCTNLNYEMMQVALFGADKGSYTGAYTQRKGILEQVNNGTLFLNEIGLLNNDMQKGLLNALDKGECQKIGGSTFITDFRLISATNEDLESKVKENKFRKDLYYRITAYPLIILPPLRERLSDIPVLLDFFISQKGKELKVAPEVLEAMHRLYWPGNIRELEKKVNFAISNCLSEKRKILTLNDFPGIRETGKRCFLEGAAADKTFEQAEIEYFQNLLNKYPKNIAEVARRAGLKRTTCISKLKKLGLLKNKPEELDVKD